MTNFSFSKYLTTTGLAMALCVPLSLSAQSAIDGLDREALGAEIRQYLLDNPEVIFEAVDIYNAQQEDVASQSDAQALETNSDALYADGHSVTEGAVDAPITIVEFFDYNCGYCRQAFDPIKEVLAANDDVKIIYKEFPILRQESLDVARVAMAINNLHGAEAYQKFHDAMMTDDAIAGFENAQTHVEAEGYDWDEVTAEAENPDIQDAISQNRALAQVLQISGTPSFIIGDQIVRGFVPADVINSIIDDIRDQDANS